MAFRDLTRGVLEAFVDAQHQQRERLHAWAAHHTKAKPGRKPGPFYKNEKARRRYRYLKALEKERARARTYAKTRYHAVLKHDPSYVAANRERAREAYARKKAST